MVLIKCYIGNVYVNTDGFRSIICSPVKIQLNTLVEEYCIAARNELFFLEFDILGSNRCARV